MLYVDFELFKDKYLETQQKYDEILSEKEALFARTQVKAVQFDKERVSGGVQSNAFESYVIEKERKQIDERLSEVRSLLEDRKELLKLKERELFQSSDIHDKIYRQRYIQRRRVYQIAKGVGYSESQVYRILSVIDEKIKDARK